MNYELLEALDAGFVNVLLARILKVHTADIGQRTQPREDIGELFFLVCLVVTMQSGRQLTDLFDEPHKSAGRTAFSVPLAVSLLNELLKRANIH